MHDVYGSNVNYYLKKIETMNEDELHEELIHVTSHIMQGVKVPEGYYTALVTKLKEIKDK